MGGLASNRSPIKPLFMKSHVRVLITKYIKQVQCADFEEANNLLDKIKELNPAMGWYHHALLYPMYWGRHDSPNKRYSKQIAFLKKSLSYDDKNANVWRYLAGIYLQLRELKDADFAIQKSLQYCKSGLCRADGLRFLGSILIAKGHLSVGLAQLNKALRHKNRPPLMQLARHFIDYYNALGNQKMVNYWVARGIKSARTIDASGKQAYGPKDVYERIIRDLEAFRK